MSIRRTVAIQVYIDQADAVGTWSGEQTITVTRGNTGSDQIVYTDGFPAVETPQLSDVVVKYWADAVGGVEIDASHASWDVGDQTLPDIIYPTGLIDTGPGFTVNVEVDTSGINMSELADAGLYDTTNNRLAVIVSAEVDQPDN